ncbi:MAG TPA: HisS family protein [Dehalococcoidia bacterium]|nr:HisS family protein [Dehalococcoidia bacterium]
MGIERVKGVRDWLPADVARRLQVEDHVRGVFDRHVYQSVDVPILEQTELYLRKSGTEVAARLYSFTDQGGRKLSLRPELTASIIRAYLDQASRLTLPLRWQYGGPVFRYERPQRGKYRQFHQQGCELIGLSGSRADAEIVALAEAALDGLGIATRTVVGHLGAVLRMLDQLRLSDRVKGFLLGNLDAIARGKRSSATVWQRLVDLGMVTEGDQAQLNQLLRGLDDDQAQAVVRGLLAGMNIELTGSREPEEIVSRLLRKLRGADDRAQLERAVQFIEALGSVRGAPERVFGQAAAVLDEYGIDHAVLDELRETTDLLLAHGRDLDRLTIDFGLARGLAYYSGLVFEIYPADDDLPVCGGGRYDGLIRALGGRVDVPALGFAYYVERILEAQAAGETAASVPAEVVIVVRDAADYPAGLRLADTWRRDGRRVTVDVRDGGGRAALQTAHRHGIPEVFLIESIGDSELSGTLREMASGQERHLTVRLTQ